MRQVLFYSVQPFHNIPSMRGGAGSSPNFYGFYGIVNAILMSYLCTSAEEAVNNRLKNVKNMYDPKVNRYLNIDGFRETVEMFIEQGEKRVYKRGEFFLHAGKVSEWMGYVADGGFRHLIYTSAGDKRIAGYSFKGEFIRDFPGLYADTSSVSIQAYKRSTVYLMRKEDVFATQSWEYRFRYINVVLENIYARLLIMHSFTPEERYIDLLTHAPDIVNEVPLCEIASYLGIRAETLSRIRKKISMTG